MPVFRLTEELIFPYPELAREDGLLAVGGDLSANRLLLAYYNGIFPWFSEEEPILWWSPDPRFVLFPHDIKVSRSMAKVLRKGQFKVTFDTSFREVITQCGNIRANDTWITNDMIEAYCLLHKLGFAHSIETWHEGRLVGGLYGVSLGKSFSGESMFSTMSNASKAALVVLAERLKRLDFSFIDCQVYSDHLQSMGAVNISRRDFLGLLKKAAAHETLKGSWSFMNQYSV